MASQHAVHRSRADSPHIGYDEFLTYGGAPIGMWGQSEVPFRTLGSSPVSRCSVRAISLLLCDSMSQIGTRMVLTQCRAQPLLCEIAQNLFMVKDERELTWSAPVGYLCGYPDSWRGCIARGTFIRR